MTATTLAIEDTTNRAALAFDVSRRFNSQPLARARPPSLLTRTTDIVPVIVPALVIAGRGTAAIGWRSWALTGLCCGVAARAALAGRIWRVVESPTRLLAFVGIAGIAAPAFSGVIDLTLRARTS